MGWKAEDLVASATKEWEYWGKQAVKLVRGVPEIVHGRTDQERKYAQYVVDEYCPVRGEEEEPRVITAEMIMRGPPDGYLWSAVALSAFLSRADVPRSEFPFSQLHWTYLSRFIGARASGDLRARYWGYRSGEVGGAPEVGDIVAYHGRPDKRALEPNYQVSDDALKAARGAFDGAQRGRNPLDMRSHADLVVAKRRGEIDVIGGNVLNSVTKKTLIDDSGHIANRTFAWFAVLRLRDPLAPRDREGDSLVSLSGSGG